MQTYNQHAGIRILIQNRVQVAMPQKDRPGQGGGTQSNDGWQDMREVERMQEKAEALAKYREALAACPKPGGERVNTWQAKTARLAALAGVDEKTMLREMRDAVAHVLKAEGKR